MNVLRPLNLPDAVLIVDRSPIFRKGLASIVREISRRRIECFEAPNLETAEAELLRRAPPQWTFIEVDEPASPSVMVLVAVRKSFPATQPIVLSFANDRRATVSAIVHGAAGYISKDSASDEVRHAIRSIMAGSAFFPLEALQSEPSVREQDLRAGGTFCLTARQAKVWCLLKEGKTNAQIAHTLGISENTVRLHVSAVLRALAVPNRIQAAMVGWQVATNATA